jgi:hypothetical protein
MQLVIATIAQKYWPTLVPGHRVTPQPAISLRARYGMRMILEPAPTPDGRGGARIAAAAPADQDE